MNEAQRLGGLMVTATIERHDDNGYAPWAVVLRDAGGMELWHCVATREIAEAKLPALLDGWNNRPHEAEDA